MSKRVESSEGKSSKSPFCTNLSWQFPQLCLFAPAFWPISLTKRGGIFKILFPFTLLWVKQVWVPKAPFNLHLKNVELFLGGLVSVKIRLKRIGSNKKACYRIVVLDSTMSGKGRRVQDLGTYNPRAKEENQVLNLNKEAAVGWVKKGAIASDTVQGILKKAGVQIG